MAQCSPEAALKAKGDIFCGRGFLRRGEVGEVKDVRSWGADVDCDCLGRELGGRGKEERTTWWCDGGIAVSMPCTLDEEVVSAADSSRTYSTGAGALDSPG